METKDLKEIRKNKSMEAAAKIAAMKTGDIIYITPSDVFLFNRIRMRAYRAGAKVEVSESGTSLIITKK